jgi:alpha-galactosidase
MTSLPLKHRRCSGVRMLRYFSILCFTALFTLCLTATAQLNGVGKRPYLGWSTFSQQTIVTSSTVMNEQNITAQSDAMKNSGLTDHGFVYINLDSGWSTGNGSDDQFGRPHWDSTAFPDFLGLIRHIHDNGQKVGIYINPGIASDDVNNNTPIFGTNYHAKDIVAMPITCGNAFCDTDKIDFTKPGAQQYINSIVNNFASWGVDFIKMDGVTPGSDNDTLSINNIPDVQAMNVAIARSGRPIWFTISWALDEDFIADWQQNANARRIENDIECEGDCPFLTEWQHVQLRFYDLIGWERAAGPSLGWNDLDALEVGNGATDGLTDTEQKTAMTFWAMANTPFFLGGDLTKLTAYGKKLLTNDEVLAVNQSGHPAVQVTGGFTPVWVSNLGNGSYYVALFNLNAFPSQVTVDWKDLGFTGAFGMRDLWSQRELGISNQSFSDVLPGHGTRLLKLTGIGRAPSTPTQIFGADTATLFGAAQLSACDTCASGNKLTDLGIGAANFAVFNVKVAKAGVYRMEVDSMTNGTRSFIINVNDDPAITLNLSGGSGNLPFPTTIPVRLKAGMNSIEFGNPASFPPDMDRIIISGDGQEPFPASTTYEGELATLSGSASQSFCGNCSGVSTAGNIGDGAQNTVTFTNVTVPATGIYQMEIDYRTSGPRSFFITVNDNPAKELDLNGTSFSTPVSTVIPVLLKAGTNQIEFGNPSSFAPDLDSINISPTVF